jgi:hypothetical protein
MERPTTSEEVVFWTQLVLANVWLAADAKWLALPYIVMALAIRLPYWLRVWKRGRAA